MKPSLELLIGRTIGIPIADAMEMAPELAALAGAYGPLSAADIGAALAEGPTSARYWRAAAWRAVGAPKVSHRRPPKVAASPSAALRAAPARSSTIHERTFADEHREHLVGCPIDVLRPSAEQRQAQLIERNGFATLRLSGLIEGQQNKGRLGSTAARAAVELDAAREVAAAAQRLKRNLFDSVDGDPLPCSPSMPLLVIIDSPGGEAEASFAVCSMLRRYSAETGPVVAFVQGQAASGACLVALSADYVVAEPWNASFLVHWCWGGDGGPGDLAVNTRVLNLVLDRTLLDEDTLRAQFLDADIDFAAHMAELRGFADERGDIDRARELTAAVGRPGGLLVHAPRTIRQQALSRRRARRS